jgi:2,6-dihydroxypseudooxynicotine hydrolase
MPVKGGRLDFLTPHLLRSQLLRPGFVSLSLRLGVARQMPPWAKLQFTNSGVSPHDLDRVLSRIGSLESWVDEWESLGREHEQGGRDALSLGHNEEAARRFLSASSAYNYAQYVMFLDIERKRRLHQSCVRAYARAAPLFDPPAVPFEVTFRRRTLEGYLRVPHHVRPAPVVVLFHGTNAVKEELHWWADALLQRGVAVITFDGPGLGQTFHRMSMVAEPRPVGTAILNAIESRPELDPQAIAFFGMSLGGYLAIRMAAHEPRVKAVAAVSPPYSADIYWNVTLSAMRRELAALYSIDEKEMSAAVPRITLAGTLPQMRAPLFVAGGGHDLITPGAEAWRIFEDARCERELIYYPKGAHDCFNVLDDLRPRLVNWLVRRLEPHRVPNGFLQRPSPNGVAPAWMAAGAVDPDFADALEGEETPQLRWNRVEKIADNARHRGGWPWKPHTNGLEVVHRVAAPGPIAPPSPA